MAEKTIDRLKPRALDPALARFVRAEMSRTGAPGIAVGVLHRGRSFAGGFGITSVAAPAGVETDTLFQIGSTTKTFTATAIMRLVEQGELELDVPVRRYLRDLRLADAEVARRVTLRHLLTHVGGWVGDVFQDTGRGDDALALIVSRLRNTPQLTPLGSVWHYNNAGFYVAGRVIEKVTGSPFETAIKDLLLTPLGMTRSFFFADEAIVYRTSAGHLAKGKKHTVAQPWGLGRNVAPAGGLISDVIDQLRWAQFHMGDGRAPGGGRVLKRSTLTQMQRPQAPAGSLADWVGISWLLQDAEGGRLVSHGGTTNGQLSAFTMVPAEDFAITVLTNSSRGGLVHRAIVNWALERYVGVRRQPPPPMSPNGLDLGAYEGRYVDGLKRVAIDLSTTGRKLRAAYLALVEPDEDPPMPPMRMALVDPDRAVVETGPYRGLLAEFLRDSRGRVEWLRMGGRIFKRRRMPAR